MTQYVNLYDADLRRGEQPVSALQAGAALGLAIVAMLAAAGVTGFQSGRLARESAELESNLAAQREQVAALGKEIAERKADPVLAGELAAAEAKLATRHQVIALLDGGTLGNTKGFADHLRAFSRQTLPGIWLTGFDIGAGGTEMAICGRALEAALLPRYVLRLSDEAVFRGRSFAALKMDAAEDKPAAAAASAAPASAGNANPAAPVEPKPSLHFVEFELASAKAPNGSPEAKP
jgi:hypothetical protein